MTKSFGCSEILKLSIWYFFIWYFFNLLKLIMVKEDWEIFKKIFAIFIFFKKYLQYLFEEICLWKD